MGSVCSIAWLGTGGGSPAGSGRIDHHQLGVLQGGDPQAGLVGDGRPVPGPDPDAIDLHSAPGRHQIGPSAGRKVIVQGFAGAERGSEDATGGADGQGLGVLREAGGQGDEPARPVAPGKGPVESRSGRGG